MKLQLLLPVLFVTFLPLLSSAKILFIVNEASSISTLSADDIADYFLKRKRQWPNGKPVRFIDRRDETPERRAFLRDFVRKSSREVDLYWIGQKLYTGDSAPIQAPSDAMTASMVSRFDGAIGYVSGEFSGAKGVRILEVTGTP